MTLEHVAFFEYGICGRFVDRVAYAAENIEESGAYQRLYRVIEKDGRDLVREPLLGLSISIYLNITCFYRLKPSNKKL